MEIKNFGAFTLAEVLVTLGIIGIVSALTVPSLTQNWQKQAYLTQLHKVYNEFQQGMEDAIAEKNYKDVHELFLGTSGTSGANAHEKDFLHNHFKVVKDCGGTTSECFASTYKTLDGSQKNASFYGYKVTIAGGAAISFNMASNGNAGQLYVDTNGKKGPNIFGRDMFVMSIMQDGTLDAYSMGRSMSPELKKNFRNDQFNSYCRSGSGYGCFGKILNDDWQMNY